MKIVKSEPSAIVVPFGKHKGATVAELLVKDPQYADWIMTQGWVAERFAELHAALTTRGAGTDDTPEHNALQARFLDEKFCIATLLAAKREMVKQAYHDARQNACWEQNSHLTDLKRNLAWKEQYIKDIGYYQLDVVEAQPWYRSEDQTQTDVQQRGSRTLREISKINADIKKYEDEKTEILSKRIPLRTSVQFEEKGVDVVLMWGFPRPDFRLGLELKPAVGDDYPSVMRQMKRLGASICVVETYTGRGVSEPQLRQMFQANGQTLVFVQDIEARNVAP